MPEIQSVHSRRLVEHEPRTWIQASKRSSMSKLRENFTKSFLCSNHHPSLYYLASASLPLPQGSPSQPYPAKVSALSLSLPTSSFPAHSASTTDIPLTVCLQYPFFLLICVALLLSGVNFSFCLAPCSLALFLWLSFSGSLSLALFSGLFKLSYLALLPAPSCFSLAPLSGLVYLGSSD